MSRGQVKVSASELMVHRVAAVLARKAGRVNCEPGAQHCAGHWIRACGPPAVVITPFLSLFLEAPDHTSSSSPAAVPGMLGLRWNRHSAQPRSGTLSWSPSEELDYGAAAGPRMHWPNELKE